MKQVTIEGSTFKLNPTKMIGEGGEALIYKCNPTTVVKIFKTPDHPSFAGHPHDQKAAQARIDEHQTKLVDFPKSLPRGVVAPLNLAHYKSKIAGFTMPFLSGMEVLLRYGEKKFRESGGITDVMVTAIFRNLHETLVALHRAGVIVGDFNDLNVLVDPTSNKPFVIDADSMQFGKYQCKVFTGKFVDPLLCDSNASQPILTKPHTESSDWYSFNVMLMQCLLYVGPYGGVYRPKDKSKKVTHDRRPLHRITVFNPEVRYPKPARHFDVLPQDVLAHFTQVFREDKRVDFPEALLSSLEMSCSTGQSGALIPTKTVTKAPAVSEVVHGGLVAKRIFRTTGRIVYATCQSRKMRWIYHDGKGWKREDGTTVVDGKRDSRLRFRIHGNHTIIARGSLAHMMEPHKVSTKSLVVDRFGELPIVDANTDRYFWVEGGQLNASLKEKKLASFGHDVIGQVIENRTLFWVGDELGFGLSRAGNISYYFVFNPKHKGINDKVKIPAIRGNLIDAKCYFTSKLIWFLYSAKEGSRVVNRCFVVTPDGTVTQHAEAPADDDSWLGSIRGHCAIGANLFVATDEGIVRVDRDTMLVTKEFPDTAPVVESDSQLFQGVKGLNVVKPNEVWELEIS